MRIQIFQMALNSFEGRQFAKKAKILTFSPKIAPQTWSILNIFGYFGIIGHSGWLDYAYSGIPDGIKQFLHVLTAVNMRKNP